MSLSLLHTRSQQKLFTDNMCKPLNDPGYYTAYNGSDTIYTDVAMQEPNILKGGCTSVPEIVSPTCSAVTGEHFSATARLSLSHSFTLSHSLTHSLYHTLSLEQQRTGMHDCRKLQDNAG